MHEGNIRKLHRRIGILLTLFIVIQVGSGVIIVLSSFFEKEAVAHQYKTTIDKPSNYTNNKVPHIDKVDKGDVVYLSVLILLLPDFTKLLALD